MCSRLQYWTNLGPSRHFPLAVGARSPQPLQAIITSSYDLWCYQEITWLPFILCVDADGPLTSPLGPWCCGYSSCRGARHKPATKHHFQAIRGWNVCTFNIHGCGTHFYSNSKASQHFHLEFVTWCPQVLGWPILLSFGIHNASVWGLGTNPLPTG